MAHFIAFSCLFLLFAAVAAWAGELAAAGFLAAGAVALLVMGWSIRREERVGPNRTRR